MSRTRTTPRRRRDRRGYFGPGGGRGQVEDLIWYRGTTVQVCGLDPWQIGSSAPAVGTPIGRHLYSGETVSFDPINWFEAGIVATPSMFCLGEPGMGKSTLIRRILLGMVFQGIVPIVMGDLKPDYADLVTALGGQVIRLGPGGGRINPLDVGPWQDAAARLGEADARTARAAVVDRRLQVLLGLASLANPTPPTAEEATVLGAAVRLLTDHDPAGQPLLSDVLSLVQDAPDPIRQVTLWAAPAHIDRYHQSTANLQSTLMGILNGALGEDFDGPTTDPIRLDTNAVCVDISRLDETDTKRTAATLLATWANGFAMVDAAQLLADAGVAPRRSYFAICDEIWRVLRSGQSMVDRCDSLLRLGRQRGCGAAYITHSLSDLEALPTPAEVAKARGFAARCAVMAITACSEDELEAIDKVRTLSRTERAFIANLTAPDSWDGEGLAPGLGKVLLKVGGKTAIPVQQIPTAIELNLGNTNFRWNTTANQERTR